MAETNLACNGCSAGCTSNCGGSCGESCGTNCIGCTGTCGSGCTSSATTSIKHTNSDKIDNSYMLDIVQNILRYVILLGGKSDIMTSADSIFKVTVEPMYYVVNITYTDSVDINDITEIYMYEYTFRINRINKDVTLNKKDYILKYNLYTEDTVDTFTYTDGGITITKEIHHAEGSRVVKSYVLYTETGGITASYFDKNGTYMQDAIIPHYQDFPCEKYSYYNTTEYDEHGHVTHYAGDIVMIENGSGDLEPLVEYIVNEYDTYWLMVSSQSYEKTYVNIQPSGPTEPNGIEWVPIQE